MRRGTDFNAIRVVVTLCPVTGKRRHPSRRSATRDIRSLKRNRGDRGLVAYVCRHCGGFHCGHVAGRAQA